MSAAFYLPDGHGRFSSTELTRGPWDPASQHAGPPAALLARALEACGAREDARLARVTFEILRPVPIAALEVSAEVMRGGRSVELLSGELSADGVPLIRVRAWRVRIADIGASALPPYPAPPPPDDLRPGPFFPTGQDVGYHTAMEVRFASGGFMEVGPAVVWMRMRQPLVAGEEPSPLVRLVTAADSGNGVSSALDFRRYMFVNTDLTVHVHRLPEGEWVCLDARTTVEPDGIGLAESTISDLHAPCARALQTLYVAPR